MDYLNTLTGCPVEDDILLFAIGVCAPYSTIINYKSDLAIVAVHCKHNSVNRF